MADKTWTTGEWIHKNMREQFERLYPSARIAYDPANHTAEWNELQGWGDGEGQISLDLLFYSLPCDENGVPLDNTRTP